MPRWYEDLRRIVLLRIARKAVPHEMALTLLRGVMDDFDCETDNHGVEWNVEAWRQGLVSRRADAARVGVLARHLPRIDVITRDDVFAIRGPKMLLLATMVWGYGSTGYGPSRALKIFQANIGGDIAQAVTALRSSAGPAAIWRAFSDGGQARLNGLGPAFASKLAYFACYDRNSGKGPLIADRNSSWGFWAIEGRWDIRESAVLYAHYVKRTATWAHGLGVRSDDIERALFVAGPYARFIWHGNK